MFLPPPVLDPMDELAEACLQRHERRTPLPRAAALLAGIADDEDEMPHPMRKNAPPPTSSGSPPSLCACPPLLAETESGAPSLQGSRLAQRWLAGVAARQALDGDDHPSTSMLDLQKLCEASRSMTPKAGGAASRCRPLRLGGLFVLARVIARSVHFPLYFYVRCLGVGGTRGVT